MNFYSFQVFMEVPLEEAKPIKNVPARVLKVMHRVGVKAVSGLANFTKDELLELKNVNTWTIEQVEMLLKERGLKLRDH